MTETFTSLLSDRAHWEFEIFVGFIETLVIDVAIIGILWPFLHKHWQHHVDRDHAETEAGLYDWSGNHPNHVLCPEEVWPEPHILTAPPNDGKPAEVCLDCGTAVIRVDEHIAICTECKSHNPMTGWTANAEAAQ